MRLSREMLRKLRDAGAERHPVGVWLWNRRHKAFTGVIVEIRQGEVHILSVHKASSEKEIIDWVKEQKITRPWEVRH